MEKKRAQGRPKSKVARERFATKLDIEVLAILKKRAYDEDVSINRLIEAAVREKYGKE